MKKLIFSLIAMTLLSFNANAQKPSLAINPCEVGQHPVLSFEFNTIRFHRASTGCERRFSICSDGTWIIDCVNDSMSRKSEYNAGNNTALIVGEVSTDLKYITLHFPIEITRLAGYTPEDFNNFGFDEDYSLTKDFIISKGEYIPTFTADEILVKVNLK